MLFFFKKKTLLSQQVRTSCVTNHLGLMSDERTLVLVKPEGFQRGKVGIAVSFLENLPGVRIVDMTVVYRPSLECVQAHLAHVQSYPFFQDLVRHYCNGPVLVVVCRGEAAVARVRLAVVGAFRPQHVCHPARSVLHASDSVSAAEHEILLWSAAK